ncbi:unnamed protein product [Owenia fusiformis]|uniref:Uncharacterized protein n=1 Tax=Owenia fusiformis TaxID=6347 RepID=A0A8J1Y681_OWEFU|nr:unnamed protein product [Owenia fusiformis]
MYPSLCPGKLLSLTCHKIPIRFNTLNSTLKVGVFEVKIENKWQPVSMADKHMAKLVCQRKGGDPRYTRLRFTEVKQEIYFTHYGGAFPKAFSCEGTETELEQCQVFSSSNWRHDVYKGQYLRKLVEIQCPEGPNPILEHSQFRLEGGHQGRLLARAQNESRWLPVCTYRYRENVWHYNVTRVVCRMLGYDESSFILKKLQFHPGGINVETDLQCMGDEGHLKDCTYDSWDERAKIPYWHHRCDTIILTCDMRHLNISLENEGQYKGIPEMSLYDISPKTKECRCRLWVCNGQWRIQEARVICRLLGFPPEYTTTSVYHFRSNYSFDNYITHKLRCEERFDGGMDCIIDTSSSCYRWHKYDYDYPAVFCHSNMPESLPTNFTARPELVSKGYGQVEIHFNSKRGAVCAHGWGINETKVACRGYTPHDSTSDYVIGEDKYGIFDTENNANDDIVMSHVKCNGDEENLSKCSYNHGVDVYCDGFKRIIVFCDLRIETIKIRINKIKYEETFYMPGKLKRRYICGDNMDRWRISNQPTAKVICRQNSQPYKRVQFIEDLSLLSEANPSFIMFDCSGNEKNVLECMPHIPLKCQRVAVIRCKK